MIIANMIIASALAFNAGADLRIRQEVYDNVPGCPGGGFMRAPRGVFTDYLRIRPRVWGEIKLDTEDCGKFRLFTRIGDEFRWNIEPEKHSTEWPCEVYLDNLFLEGNGLFDGLFDFKVGRQDVAWFRGLSDLFYDTTPGDGSRSLYTDMARITFHVDEKSTLDIFGLYNFDCADDMRWGNDYKFSIPLASRFVDSEGNRDDYGYGAIWTSALCTNLPYQIFVAQKQMKHVGPYPNHTELVGFKLMPKWNDEFSSTFEVMSELDGEWSSHADIGWKSSSGGVRPFWNLGYHYFSKDWDPMWSRAVNYSEMFLYGTLNGIGWWNNMHFLKLTAGLDFGPHHSLALSTGPIFAEAADGVGGGEGYFKGELSRINYEFPLITAQKGDRFEAFGHIFFEYFNPGDYYESSVGAWFFRWQVEFRF